MRTNSSLVQQVADRHPIVFFLYHLFQGKFTIPKQPVNKAESIYEPSEYRGEDDTLLGKLIHHDGIPVLEIYTADPALKATVKAELTAKVMMDFYLQYIQYLPIAARINTKTYLTDPMEHTNKESRRRLLDFSFIETELHYMLLAFNRYIAKYNTTVYSFLQLPFLTFDDLRAMVSLCDTYKGMACSAAVCRENERDYLIRNLDWTSLGVLGSHTLGTLTLTNHQDENKPAAVYSIGLTPGILGLSMANDKGLVITLNEATKNDTKRQNQKQKATPQFILIRQLIENCCTVKEVKEFLNTHQPATSHILTVMDAKGSKGVLELLPNRGEFATEIYRFRGIDLDDLASAAKSNSSVTHRYQQIQLVTNHFLDKNNLAIPGTEGFDCSFKRYNDMENALNNEDDPEQIAQSSCVQDTVQTLIYEHNKGQFTLKINVANAFSAYALDPNGKLHYTTVNLTDQFSRFLSHVKKETLPCLPPKDLPNNLEEQLHTLLIKLNRVAEYNTELSKQLSHDYSQLCTHLALTTTKQNRLTRDEIVEICTSLVRLIDMLNLGPSNKHEQREALIAYNKRIQDIESRMSDKKGVFYQQVAYGLFAVVATDLISAWSAGNLSSSFTINGLRAIGHTLLNYPQANVLMAGFFAFCGNKWYQQSGQSFFSRLSSSIDYTKQGVMSNDDQNVVANI